MVMLSYEIPPHTTTVPSDLRARLCAAPAATVTTTAVPATVKPEDRQLYLQMLKALGGNVNAALAALAAMEAEAGS